MERPELLLSVSFGWPCVLAPQAPVFEVRHAHFNFLQPMRMTVMTMTTLLYKHGPGYAFRPDLLPVTSCGNVASILELDEHLGQEYKVFSHAPSVSSRYHRPNSPFYSFFRLFQSAICGARS